MAGNLSKKILIIELVMLAEKLVISTKNYLITIFHSSPLEIAHLQFLNPWFI